MVAALSTPREMKWKKPYGGFYAQTSLITGWFCNAKIGPPASSTAAVTPVQPGKLTLGVEFRHGRAFWLWFEPPLSS